MEKRLTADLNVVANSNLEIQLLDGDLNIIQKLDDEPNDVGGLTSAELKAKFDESGNIIKKYINETLIPAVLTDDATEESRKQAEAARVAAEQGRVTAEEGRVSAESGRVSAEQARANAEASRVSAETARVQAETARADETAGIVARATAQANAAAGSASQAAGSEQAAQSAANTASSAASSASQSAATASGSASQAQASAAAAAQSAASVDGVNKTAKSWAVGGTGTRPGEDTNNAKYWAGQAQAAVGGDFATKTEAQGYVTEHNQSVNAHADIRAAVAGSVRYDAAQSLSDAQQAQARGNINAAATGGGVMEYAKSVSVSSADETYESFCQKVDAILATMPANSVKFVAAYPPGWYGDGQDMALLYKSDIDANHASLKSVGSYNPAKPNGFMMIKRKRSSSSPAGQWDPLEYIDPPMALGVEYRTTERYLGKPVYCKLINCGKFPSPGNSIQVAHGISNCYPISITARMSNGNTVPFADMYTIGTDGINVILASKSGVTNQSANDTVALMRYTKTTD